MAITIISTQPPARTEPIGDSRSRDETRNEMKNETMSARTSSTALSLLVSLWFIFHLHCENTPVGIPGIRHDSKTLQLSWHRKPKPVRTQYCQRAQICSPLFQHVRNRWLRHLLLFQLPGRTMSTEMLQLASASIQRHLRRNYCSISREAMKSIPDAAK